MKKAQGISLNAIIISALALIVLVVVVVIFVNREKNITIEEELNITIGNYTCNALNYTLATCEEEVNGSVNEYFVWGFYQPRENETKILLVAPLFYCQKMFWNCTLISEVKGDWYLLNKSICEVG